VGYRPDRPTPQGLMKQRASAVRAASAPRTAFLAWLPNPFPERRCRRGPEKHLEVRFTAER